MREGCELGTQEIRNRLVGATHCFARFWALANCVHGPAHIAVPLTPALSPRRGGTIRPLLDKLNALGLQPRRDALLPLSKGEGRGEGEEMFNHSVVQETEMRPSVSLGESWRLSEWRGVAYAEAVTRP
jgi:hypothetical protein